LPSDGKDAQQRLEQIVAESEGSGTIAGVTRQTANGQRVYRYNTDCGIFKHYAG